MQTNEKIQLTYEALIKVCLRHHPDILIIGEIRDGETAQAVIRAALTGHTILRQFTPVTYWGATAFDRIRWPRA